MGEVRTSGCALVLFGSLVFFASTAFGQACTPVVYAFRHAEDTNPPNPPGPIFALTPSGAAHAELYPTMVKAFEDANNFCSVAKVYAATTARKIDTKKDPCGNACESATNAFDTATPLAKKVMSTDPITTVGNNQLYEYLGNGNAAPTSPNYSTDTAKALRTELLATANAGESSAIFWTSQGLHVLGGAIINGTSKVPDKNGNPKVVPPRNAVYIFKADGSAPNIATFSDIVSPSLYVQCYNWIGVGITVAPPPGPRFINPAGSPPTQLYFCGKDGETVLGGPLGEACACGAQCGTIPNGPGDPVPNCRSTHTATPTATPTPSTIKTNKDILGKICNTTTSMEPNTSGANTFGACK